MLLLFFCFVGSVPSHSKYKHWSLLCVFWQELPFRMVRRRPEEARRKKIGIIRQENPETKKVHVNKSYDLCIL